MIHVTANPPRPATPSGSRNITSVPSLPPLEIPKSAFLAPESDTASALSVLDSESDDRDPIPSSAHPSEESYATAFTSPFPVGVSFKDDTLVASTLSSNEDDSGGGRTLAKSMSVDSFVRVRQGEKPSKELDVSTRSASPADSVSTSLRTVGRSSQHRLSAGDQETAVWRGEHISSEASFQQYVGNSNGSSSTALHLKSRYVKQSDSRTSTPRAQIPITGGQSFVPMGDDEQDNSPNEDSDVDPPRYNAAPQPREIVHKRALMPKRSGSLPASNVSQSKFSLSLRAARLSGNNPTGSLTNLTTKNLPIRGTYSPRMAAIQSPTLRNKLSMPATFEPPPPSHPPLSRMRSHSIGDNPKNGITYEERQSEADAQTDYLAKHPHARDLAFAVVGAPGCGKSTFIRKTLKQNGVSMGESFSVKVSEGGDLRSIECVERRSYVTALFEDPLTKERFEKGFNVTFLEVDVRSFLDAHGNLCDNGWPASLPLVDGIFICYDAADRNSFAHIGCLLSGYDVLNIPTMVLACKSDLDKRISPSDALSTIQKYAGLVEISSQTDSGKKKMRRSLDLFIKMLEKVKMADPHYRELGYRNPVSPDALNPPPSPWNTIHISHNQDGTRRPSSLRTSLGGEGRRGDSLQIHLPEVPVSKKVSLSPSNMTSSSPPTPMRPSNPTKATRAPSPPSPIRARSMSDLLTDNQKHAKQTRDQLSFRPLLDSQPPGDGSNLSAHGQLDRKKTRSIMDIAKEDALAVALSNDAVKLDKSFEAISKRKDSEEGIDPGNSLDVQIVDVESKSSATDGMVTLPESEGTKQMKGLDEEHDTPQSIHQENEPLPIIGMKKQKEPPPNPFATLQELLDKLFFVAVSGDDPSFITHFFLTCRRFATPRSILLAMQRKMLELSKEPRDVTMAAYAQMRICNLLEIWMNNHRSDFSTAGAAGALTALVKQILKQPHTLYYGSDFLPFLELLPTLVDQDSSWALKATDASIAPSDESDTSTTEDFDEAVAEAITVSDIKNDVVQSPIGPESSPNSTTDSGPFSPTRERKSSIPLSAKSLLGSGQQRSPYMSNPLTPKEMLSRLVKTATAMLSMDSELIAQEITRKELQLFLQIEPRDWLRHTLVSGKKDPRNDKIARFNASYNDIHEWAVSLILCHDKVKNRAKQVEKFADVGAKLRNMNNYSGLRAIITAINQSTYPGDEVWELFKQKVDLHKKFLSSDILLRTVGAHQSYRLALRNTKGPCIPSIEVHTSDMLRAHEGNADTKGDDPTKVHWAKFDMLGKFVAGTSQYQSQCRGPNGYRLPENSTVMQLFDVPVMDYDMQQSRMYPPSEDDIYATPYQTSMTLEHSNHSKEAGMIKRLFFGRQ